MQFSVFRSAAACSQQNLGDWCLSVYVDAIKLFQFATPPTVFVSFSQNLAHMICVLIPVCKKLKLFFFLNLDFNIFGI